MTKKRVREANSPESDLDSPAVKLLRDDLLDLLDDSDAGAPPHDLESVIKSFAEEISPSPSRSPPATVTDPGTTSGETPPDLGYLLGASDDELGLPPSVVEEDKLEEANPVRYSSYDSSGIGEFWGFGDDIPSYESFDFGIVGGEASAGEYMPLGGLFDYSDPGFGPTEFADLPRRSETLPAL